MLSNLLSSVLSAIASFFIWLWDKISAFFVYLWHNVWNTIVDKFWDFYALIVHWLADSIAYLFPSDYLDFEDQTDLIIQYIAGWDQILPIHETFYLLNVLWVYFTSKMVVRYGLVGVRLVRKLLPF